MTFSISCRPPWSAVASGARHRFGAGSLRRLGTARATESAVAASAFAEATADRSGFAEATADRSLCRRTPKDRFVNGAAQARISGRAQVGRWPRAVLRRCLALLALLAALSPCAGQEWTRFRGPNGSGLSAAKTIPALWTEKDINWKAPLPGPGHSSPVLWGERIFLTTGDVTSNQVWVLCLSAGQGQVLWQRGFPIPAYHKNGFNTVASGSPAVDEQRVYVCWTTPERFTLAAFEHEGKGVWEKDLGPFISQHGGGASPIVLADKVILANQQDGRSFVLAVDAATGQTRWQTARRTTEANYATPCVYDPGDGQPTLVLASHSHGLSGIDPASGKVLWELAGVFDKRVVSSPVMAAGLIIGACGSGEGGNYLVAARPPNPRAAKPAELAYTIRRAAPYVPTSLCLGELLFLWGDDGTVSCVQAATGELKWQERLGKHYFGSPVCVDGRLFAVSTSGEVAVVRAADHFELLARNSLGETTHSTPAVAGGRMYIHAGKHLFSIGGPPAGPKE